MKDREADLRKLEVDTRPLEEVRREGRHSDRPEELVGCLVTVDLHGLDEVRDRVESDPIANRESVPRQLGKIAEAREVGVAQPTGGGPDHQDPQSESGVLDAVDREAEQQEKGEKAERETGKSTSNSLASELPNLNADR